MVSRWWAHINSYNLTKAQGRKWVRLALRVFVNNSKLTEVENWLTGFCGSLSLLYNFKHLIYDLFFLLLKLLYRFYSAFVSVDDSWDLRTEQPTSGYNGPIKQMKLIFSMIERIWKCLNLCPLFLCFGHYICFSPCVCIMSRKTIVLSMSLWCSCIISVQGYHYGP